MLHRARTQNRKSLVILDEIHHAGDALSLGGRHRVRRSNRPPTGWP